MAYTLSARTSQDDTFNGRGADATERDFMIACRTIADIPNRYRAVGSWLAQFAMLVSMTDDEEIRGPLLEDIERANTELDHVIGYFTPGVEVAGENPQAVEWFRDCLAQCPDGGEVFRTTGTKLRAIHAAAQRQDADVLHLHVDIAVFAVANLGPAYEILFARLSEALSDQAFERQRAMDSSRKQADAAIRRIADISQMVSLISLNASVEAARAAEAGKGFAVIAQEIKGLSEQISTTNGEVSNTLGQLIKFL